MAVEIEGEAEVAQVLRRISRLLHRLQQDAVDQELVLFLPHVLQYGLEREPASGIGFVRDSQGLQQSLEIVQLLALRRFVDTVDARGCFCSAMKRATASFAAIINSSMMLWEKRRSDLQDVLDPAFHVEDQLRLGQVEIEVPLRLTARFQHAAPARPSHSS